VKIEWAHGATQQLESSQHVLLGLKRYNVSTSTVTNGARRATPELQRTSNSGGKRAVLLRIRVYKLTYTSPTPFELELHANALTVFIAAAKSHR
jgi:hypothetical protein